MLALAEPLALYQNHQDFARRFESSVGSLVVDGSSYHIQSGKNPRKNIQTGVGGSPHTQVGGGKQFKFID